MRLACVLTFSTKSHSKPFLPVCKEHFAVQTLYKSLCLKLQLGEAVLGVHKGYASVKGPGVCFFLCQPNMHKPIAVKNYELGCTGRGLFFWSNTQPMWVTKLLSVVEGQMGLSCGCLGVVVLQSTVCRLAPSAICMHTIVSLPAL